jgi:hypothetical protein
MSAVPNEWNPSFREWTSAGAKEPESFAFGSEKTVALLRETNGLTFPSSVDHPTETLETFVNAAGVGSTVSAVPKVSVGKVDFDEVRKFAERHGYSGDLKKLAAWTWATRYEIENGLREPFPVNAAALPADVPDYAQRYWHGFVHLLEIRWSDPAHRGKGAVFAAAFAAVWCGVEKWQTKEARQLLVELGLLIDSGERWGKATLWLPKVAE